jgi:G3E family GTPase
MTKTTITTTATTPIPVTLLSGFLGAGKTTLLKNILMSADHGLRIAVIVNDMAALNIDAAQTKQLVQKQERLVAMQNGCICCTLRTDLVEEVAALVERGGIDYLVIESTGISEPIQVAETFTKEFAAEMIDTVEDEHERHVLTKISALGGLSALARLDTCVSVVDARNFWSTFNTADLVADREDGEEGDERTISDLMIDQIEFANVILLNKTDLVSAEEAAKIEALLRTLNPKARILRTRHSRVDLREILNTKLFDFEEASTSAGWLQSLNEQQAGKLVPETVEYGVTSFVYRRRRPFHPRRLWDLLDGQFFLIQESNQQEDEEGDDFEESDGEEEEEEEGDEDAGDGWTIAEVIANKAKSPFGAVLRSKGQVFIASAPGHAIDWSQAGCMLTLSAGQQWFACMSEYEWEEMGIDSDDLKAQVRRDFVGEWGDRRQELVVIGADMDRSAIEKVLDSALLDDEEFSQWEQWVKSGGRDADLYAEDEDMFEVTKSQQGDDDNGEACPLVTAGK